MLLSALRVSRHISSRLLNNCQPKSRTMSSLPVISVTPKLGLLDDDIHIRVQGLNPNQDITLQAFLSENNHKFISCGQYSADNNGEVDCKRDSSVGGTYRGVEKAGLIWSLIQAPGQREGLRLMKRDVTEPHHLDLYLYQGHHDVETCYEKQTSETCLSKTVFSRTHKHANVVRSPIRYQRLRGTLFTPPGPGPFPVVIDVFGTAGGLIESRAALLASRGILTLALAYFDYQDLPPFLDNIDLDYFEEAVDYISSLPKSNNNGVGVVGVSKGAEIALQMSELMPKVRAVVSINGLYYSSTVSCTYKRRKLPFYVPDYGKTEIINNAASFVSCFDREIVDEKFIIKVEKSDAKFLFLVSESDGQCPPFMSEISAERLVRAGKGNNCEFHLARGAGHLLEPPHSPFCKASYHKKFGTSLLWGGERVAHVKAQEIAWLKTLKFLHENLGGISEYKSKL